MKKPLILLTFTSVVGIGSFLIYAQDPMGSGMMGGGMMGGGMMGRGMMGEGTTSGQQNEWQAPSDASNRSNPVPADRNSVATGKMLFNRYCASCHGVNGKGNGVAADLTDPTVQSQTDGALFWKISQGRSPMPRFADILTAHQGWDIVNYIRTLASEPAQNSTTIMQSGTSGGIMGWDGMMMNGMGSMMSSIAMVVTQDGGVIVMIGNELLKYDKDLNLVKKTEIKFDFENWQKMMMQHRNMMMGEQSR